MKILAILFAAGVAQASTPVTADIRLVAQLWKRPTAVSDRLKFTALGDPSPIEIHLVDKAGERLARSAVNATELSAKILFVLAIPTAPGAPYVVTQAQLYLPSTDGAGALVAECSNFDSLGAENSLGVGVCSGVKDGVQYGLTFSKAK